MIFERRYVFQGHAVAAAANFSRYKDKSIQMQTCFEGAAALPPTGGCVEGNSGPKRFDHPEHGLLLSLESATARMTGAFSDPELAADQTHGRRLQLRNPVRVTAEASVRGLNVQDRLKIESLAAIQDTEDARTHGEIRFGAPATPEIEGVTIDGHPLTVEVDRVFLDAETRQSLIDEFRHDKAFRREYASRFYRTGAHDDDDHGIPVIRGFIVASVVKRVAFPNGTPKDASVEGNSVTLPGFGKIFFGEMIIGKITRRLTLVRLQMGSDAGGDGSFSDTMPNGRDLP